MGNNCCCDRRTQLQHTIDDVNLSRKPKHNSKKTSDKKQLKPRSTSKNLPLKPPRPKTPTNLSLNPSHKTISKQISRSETHSPVPLYPRIIIASAPADSETYKQNDESISDGYQSSQDDLTLPLNDSKSDSKILKSFSIHFTSISDEDYEFSIDEALYYSLETVKIFNAYQRSIILKLFSTFSNDIPLDSEEEALEGVVTVDKNIHSYSTEMHILVTNYSLYLVTPEDLLLDRRLKITDITLLGLTKDYSSIIFHTSNQDVNGDLRVNSGNASNLAKAVQALYKHRTRHYIPFYSEPTENALNRRFNNINLNFLQTFQTKEMVAVIDLLCKEGSLGENVLYIKRCSRVKDLEGKQEILALLTEKALYALTPEYEVIDKTYVQYIVSVHVVEGNSKIVIKTENGESYLWALPDSFLEKLEKTVMIHRKNKLKVESVTENKAESMLSSGMSAYFSSTKDPRSPSLSSMNSANPSRRGSIRNNLGTPPIPNKLKRPNSYPNNL